MSDVTNKEKLEFLLEQLKTAPVAFKKANGISNLLELKDEDGKNILKPATLTPILRKIFDVNDGKIANNSSADKGFFGWVNKYYRNKKNKIFKKRIRKGDYEKILVTEGDSWFEYPVFLKEVIDQLNRLKNDKGKHKYAIYSIASAGDWMSNMMHDQEYIEALSWHQPDAFLVSGGGNDIAGKRLAQLLNRYDSIEDVHLTDSDYKGNDKALSKDAIDFAEKCFNEQDFERFMLLMELQYQLLFLSIKVSAKPKFENLKVITHGYDYLIPSDKKPKGIKRFFPKKFRPNGIWLHYPLLLRGYTNPLHQRIIIKYFVNRFNEMLIGVANTHHEKYEGEVLHVDNRNVIDKNGWHDEIHPTSKEFKVLAKIFSQKIG